ncbi:hypothetical protein EV191_10742 [Tamaricihabitans halophyticus]|uniref:HTH cro/C1-type domain-containing protein n=1 Tax=Tamaricihabitans halophyticus TaxID=1262583 RepID=A0A4R2QMK0_9PSEU|nr:helix-turn-helix domain-containing protein [Tamaricihabitans halophyticus]TCP50782.1 hypothetical protein EV191_10742 [Tamaricihabitans halophyticus]
MDDRGRSFADKLNKLFAIQLSTSGQEYSNEQVAAAITSRGEVTISQSYLWQLRKAKKDNPTVKHLQALAGFFGVPTSYFFDDATTDRVDAQLADLRAERARLQALTTQDDARLMAMRAGELSAHRRQQVMDLLDVVYQLERAERGESTPD